MKIYKNLVFFALLACGSSNLYAETYLNSSEVKELLNKIEGASAVNNQSQDLIQKEVNEIQKKVNLNNQRKSLENSELNLGLTEESTNKRAKALQKHYSSVTSIEEYIYSDNFTYQSICKGTVACKPTALVDSEVFNQKIQNMSQKIVNDKVAIIEGIEDISPANEKLPLLKQIEQTTYNSNNGSNMSSNNSYSNNNKRKKYIEINDGDTFGKVKVSISPNYIKLTKK